MTEDEITHEKLLIDAFVSGINLVLPGLDVSALPFQVLVEVMEYPKTYFELHPELSVKGGEIMYHLGGRALRCGV